MSEMIEMVSAAIDESIETQIGHGHNVVVSGVTRAAIAAMREPTRRMLEAGMDRGAVPICDGEMLVRWQAMIDEILS